MPLTGGGETEGNDIDLSVDQRVFERPVISVIPRAALSGQESPGPDDTAELSSTTTVPVPIARAPHSAKAAPDAPPERHKAILERRSPDSLRNFTRVVIRPETSVAAQAAAGESAGAADSDDPAAQKYGKLKSSDSPDLRQSRLQHVLNETWLHSPLRWLEASPARQKAGIALIALAAVCGGIYIWKSTAPLPPPRDEAAALPPLAERKEAIDKTMQQIVPARTWQEMLPLTDDPGKQKPAMEVYYDQWKSMNPAVISWEVGEPSGIGAEWWFPVLIREAGGDSALFHIRETAQGGRIDWPNFVGAGSMQWSAFVNGKPAEAQAMRIRVSTAGNFAGKYTAERYRAFSLRHREEIEPYTGYAQTGTREEQALTRLCRNGTWRQAHLFLKFEPDAATPRAMLIAGLKIEGWQDEYLLQLP